MFQFKQFTINQENAAMKVCTDACLFGAFIPIKNHKNALDIGAGTGLLSLMLCQKSSELKITAVELDEHAILDAKQNISESIFKNQIELIHSSIQDFTKETEEKFDLIVTNPPFFQNNLASPDEKRNKALHASTLSFEELSASISQLITSKGDAWVLLPPFEMELFQKIAEKASLFLNKKVEIKHNEKKPIFRNFGLFRKENTNNIVVQEINIYENGQYSPIFVELLKDYYLIF